MDRADQEIEMAPWHLLLAVGWGFLTAVAFMGDVYRFSDKGRPVHLNVEKLTASESGVAEERVARERPAATAATEPASSTTKLSDSGLSPMERKREAKRQELRNESTLNYGNTFEERSDVSFLYILPCGLFFGASCILTFCGPKGRVAGTALGLSVLWIWAFQHSSFWHPRWM
jgi:hypothetical protein